MHTMFRKFITALPIILLPLKEYAQSVQRYQNCLYAEYGVVQYNNTGREWLGASGNILSAGLGYNREIFSFLALGLKAKYYEQALTKEIATVNEEEYIKKQIEEIKKKLE